MKRTGSWWLKRGGIALALLIAALLVVGVLLPDRMHVQRSVDIAVPPANVFTVLDNFHVFKQWSPWASLDPAAQYRYSGPWSGMGASMAWHSANPEVGSGSETITASEPGRYIALKLDFKSRVQADAAFTLTPIAGGTHVTWSYDKLVGWNLFARYTGLLFKHWISDDYEAGLKNLKRFAESLPKTDLAGADIHLLQMQPVSIVYASGQTTTDGRDVANALDHAYAEVRAFVVAQHLKVTGAPIAVTRTWDPEHNRYVFDAALPADWNRVTVPAGSPVKLGQTQGGNVVLATWTGPYSGTGRVYQQLAAWLAANGLTATGLSWEQYPNNPANTPDAQLVTRIYTPVK